MGITESYLAAYLDTDSFFAKKAIIECSNHQIEIKLSKRTLVVALSDIVLIKIVKIYLFGGRIIHIRTNSGATIAIRISDYQSFEKYIYENKQGLTVQYVKNPVWFAILYIVWIILVVAYAPTMSYFSSYHNTINAILLASIWIYFISMPILLFLNFMIIRLIPPKLQKKWLLWLWGGGTVGLGIVLLAFMNNYATFHKEKFG